MARGAMLTSRIILGLLVLVCGVLNGSLASERHPSPSSGPGEETSKKTPSWTGPYALGHGDGVNVFVWKHPELSMKTWVLPDGALRYPLVGEMAAEGLRIRELEEKIARGLARYVQNPQVTAMLFDLHSFHIYVLGEVGNSGAFNVPGPTTVIQAITMAGGFTPFASRDKIIIVNSHHGHEERLSFNYFRFLGGEDVAQNIVLRPGDTILVP